MINFEPLELKQSNIPHLKVLMCDINASDAQWCGHMSIFYFTHMKSELLLHKTVLVTFLLVSTVEQKLQLVLTNNPLKMCNILRLLHLRLLQSDFPAQGGLHMNIVMTDHEFSI